MNNNKSEILNNQNEKPMDEQLLDKMYRKIHDQFCSKVRNPVNIINFLHNNKGYRDWMLSKFEIQKDIFDLYSDDSSWMEAITKKIDKNYYKETYEKLREKIDINLIFQDLKLRALEHGLFKIANKLFINNSIRDRLSELQKLQVVEILGIEKNDESTNEDNNEILKKQNKIINNIRKHLSLRRALKEVFAKNVKKESELKLADDFFYELSEEEYDSDAIEDDLLQDNGNIAGFSEKKDGNKTESNVLENIQEFGSMINYFPPGRKLISENENAENTENAKETPLLLP